MAVVAGLAAAATAFWLGGFLRHAAAGKGSWGTVDLEMYFYARAAAAAEEAHAAVTDPAFRPGEEAVVEAPLPVLAPPAGEERVALVADEPERVTVAAEVTAPALLVLTDTFFPGWEARVDGTPAPILRADYAFRGVALGAGEHRIVFRYRPWSFYTGVALAAGALALALGAAVRRRA